MSSPFSIFRKNQWTMMAILGVLLMIAFVIFPMLDLLIGNRQGGGDSPVAVELRKVGERLTENQMATLMQRRQALLRFLSAAVDKAYGGGQFAGMYAQTILGGTSEGAVVGSWLLARKADDLGIAISNKTVNDFLKRTTAGRVTDAQFHTLAVEQKLTDTQVFEWLRQELKALYVRQMVLEEPAPAEFNRWFRAYITRQPLPDGVTAITPEQRYEYYAQTSASVELELLPIKIADLAAKVPAPSDAELKSFFEKHKNNPARPRSADLGFKAPPRAKFEYLQADPKYIEALAAKQAVTDQEIAKYYEDNKRTLYVDRSAGFEKGLDDSPKDTPPDEGKQPEAKAGEKSAPAKGSEDAPKDAPKKDAPKDSGEKAPEKADAPKDAEKKAGADKKQDDDEGGCQDSSAKDAKPESAKADDAKQDDAKKDTAKTDAPKADAAKTDAGASGAGKDAEATKLPPVGAEDPAKADVPEIKFKPLNDELKAEIKKQLQTKAARSAAEKKLLEIRSSTMRKYGVEYVRWEQGKGEKKSSAKPPAEPDLKELADKEGLKYDRTLPLSQFEASEFKPLGQTFVGGAFPIAGGRNDAFFFRAYQDIKLFDPFLAADEGNENLFVFWKTEEIEAHVPKFDEVRDQVLAAWKANKARAEAAELAKNFLKAMEEKPAESLLGTRKHDSSKLPDDLALPTDIHDFTPPNPAADPIVKALGPDAAELVVNTRPFQWRMVFPTQMGQMMPMLNQFVQGLPREDITEAFMNKVFSLQTGEFAEYENPTQDTLYLLRVVRKTPAFKFDFLDRGGQIYVPLAAVEKTEFVHRRFQELEFEYGLEWHRDLQPERE